MRVGQWTAAVVAIVAIAGCGSSARQARRVDVHAIATSTSGAGTARFETSFVVWNEGDDVHHSPQSTTSRVSGSVDFANDTGLAKDDPIPSPSTMPAGDLPEPPFAEREQRWIGSMLYITPGMLSSPSAGSGGQRWDRYDTGGVSVTNRCGEHETVANASLLTGSLVPIDPNRVLDDLIAEGDTITSAGTAVVRSVTTTRWNVVYHGSASCRVDRSNIPQFTVFTDDRQRLRRVSVSISLLKSKLPPMTITTDLFDFGTPVHVDAPPRDRVTDITDFMTALSAGPGKLDGGWRLVAQNAEGAPFRLWYARTTTGWRCFDLEPPLAAIEELGNARNRLPLHDGHVPQCLQTGAPPAAAVAGFVARTSGDREQIVVAFAPGYTNARIVHTDRSTTPIPIDATTGVVNWTGATTPAVARVEADGPLGEAHCSTSADTTPDSGGVLGASISGLPGACGSGS